MKDRFTGILSKSDNALLAEEEGKVTFSMLSAWQKRAVAAGAVAPCEWHHTSAAANRTNYYDPADFDGLDASDFPPERAERAVQAELSRLRIRIVYDKAVSGFSARAALKFEEVVCEGGPDVRKRDNAILGTGGRRLSSHNREVRFYHLPPRCRKWREVSRKQAEELGYVFA